MLVTSRQKKVPAIERRVAGNSTTAVARGHGYQSSSKANAEVARCKNKKQKTKEESSEVAFAALGL
jgi:hypothetical protein